MLETMAYGKEASYYKPKCILIRIISRKEDILTAMENRKCNRLCVQREQKERGPPGSKKELGEKEMDANICEDASRKPVSLYTNLKNEKLGV